MPSLLHILVSFVISRVALCEAVPKESISSHVLDTVSGEPAQGVALIAYIWENNTWKKIDETFTGIDGRVQWVAPNSVLRKATYKLWFGVEDYYMSKNMDSFYPYAEVVFKVDDPSRHYHVPLTVSPYAYSTYRGS